MKSEDTRPTTKDDLIDAFKGTLLNKVDSKCQVRK